MEANDLLPKAVELKKSDSSNVSTKSCLLFLGIFLLGVLTGIPTTFIVFKLRADALSTNSSTSLLTCGRSSDQLQAELTIEKTRLKDLEDERDQLKERLTEKETLLDEHQKKNSNLQNEKTQLHEKENMLNEHHKSNLSLQKEKNSLAENLNELIQNSRKCQASWIYFKETDSCYFYHSFTIDDKGKMNTYRWKTAERICVETWASHLVSIHSKAEADFVKSLILSDVTNPKALATNACSGSDLYVWNGLHIENGIRKWSDGTEDDFFEKDNKTTAYYFMCHDVKSRDSNLFFYNRNETSVNARYVCKKPAQN